MRSNFPAPRRGVLLILILSLLAMFGLIALTFVLIVGQAQRSAKNVENADRVVDPPQKLLNEAVMQCLRGSKNDLSAMGPHSLLEDMYGNDWLTGTVTVQGTTCGGQLLDVTTSLGTGILRHGGCALTIQGKPQSSRIVSIDTANNSAQIVNVWGTSSINGLTCLINGSPFSGTGLGYNPTTGKLNLQLVMSSTGTSLSTAAGTMPAALFPNISPSLFKNAVGVLQNQYGYPLGGANEDYDAADYQNMILAAQAYNATTLAVQTIPSFHRPALARYWVSNRVVANFNALPVDLQAKILMRPLGQGVTSGPNPNFTGSNPSVTTAVPFDPINGPWDVDNDGDGVPDSIWVDLGMPVRKAKDGRLYKPLFAVLCVDMDGRVNLNAHGNLAQTDTTNYNGTINLGGGSFANSNGDGSALTSVSDLSFGQGYGPADVNLTAVMPNDCAKILASSGIVSASGTHFGRYGSRKSPGAAAVDPLTSNKWFEFGGDYGDTTSASGAGSYGAPPDLQGAGAVALDYAGHPVFLNFGAKLPATVSNFELDTLSSISGTALAGATTALQNVPYAFNIADVAKGLPPSAAAVNNPFSVGELERLLRPFDRDAVNLPNRLTTLGANDLTGANNVVGRLLVTTESWDVPTLTVGSGTSTAHQTCLADLLVMKGIPSSQWENYFPPEMFAGLKLDLNRPIGDGRDDALAPNGVVDEPGESLNNLTLFTSKTNFETTSPADVSNKAQNSLKARQLQTRYLYLLAMLVVDRAALRTELGNINGAATDQDVARYLAQWAVNVVDFRDRDSIMTPFKYDPDPFNDYHTNTDTKWRADDDLLVDDTVNGIPAAVPHVVWGCERPELLITETLALHDRRTEDLDSELPDPSTDQAAKTTATTNPDTDFDQKFKPEGSLFVELYNPQNSNEAQPAELTWSSSLTGGVDLTKTTPTGGSPIWRLAIVTSTTNLDHDPDDLSASAITPDRTVYFVDSGVTLPTDGATVQFRLGTNFTSANIAPVNPGRYVVIGPGNAEDTLAQGATTYLGFRNNQRSNGETQLSSTRRIRLTPASGTTSGQVALYSDGTNNAFTALAGSTTPPTAIVITSPQRLSVSEPDDGYPKVDATGAASTFTAGYGSSGGYTKPYDIPLDKKKQGTTKWTDLFFTNGTHTRFAVVHLQRLANPLVPYDAETNPYRTIDSMSVDLTTFNGVENDNAPTPATITALSHGLFSRERGTGISSIDQPILWAHQPDLTNSVTTADFDAYIKGARTKPSDDASYVLQQTPVSSFGYLNESYGAPSSLAGYVGSPQYAFPWLTWNNRPFVSNYELMLVPTTSSYELLRKWSYHSSGIPHDTYAAVSSAVTSAGTTALPFGHLPNFFRSDTPGANPSQAPELHRILDYVTVPSRFVGTDIFVNPNNNADEPFKAPFNHIPTYREPGKINLNTIYDQRVFDGLMNYSNSISATDRQTLWQNFIQSRTVSGTSVNVFYLDSSVPSEFSRPFRTAAGASLMPVLLGNSLDFNRESQATILRENGSRSLFERASTNPYSESERNPFFRYQGLSRIGNLVTTRSNVYSIWITVGYFEVIPQAVDALHPDGYQLGQELGSDTGEIERHRSFYIIDRSQPVGFIRGEDWNAEKAIILNRYIE